VDRAASNPRGEERTARQLAELEASADRLEELGRSSDQRSVPTDRSDRQIEELEGSADRLADLSLPRSTDRERVAEQSRRVAELEQSANRLDELEQSAREAAAGGRSESRRGRVAAERARRTAELKQSESRFADLERSASRTTQSDGEAEAGAKATTGRPASRNAAPATVVASADDPDAKPTARVSTSQPDLDGRARSVAKPSAAGATVAKSAEVGREKIDANKTAVAADTAGLAATMIGTADASSVVTTEPAGDTAKAADGDARPTGLGPAADTDDSIAKDMAERDMSNARLSAYQVEVAELLAGAAARRKRRTSTASGLPAPDPATQEPPIKLTRPSRPGSAKSQAKD
jgi:hypothetical protein